MFRPLATLQAALASSLLVGCVVTLQQNAPANAEQAYEVVHVFDSVTPPGNLAISQSGRLFMSVHGFFGEPENHVVEVHEDGTTTPYPNQAWSCAPDAQGIGLNDVLGVRVDQDGILWMLDGQGSDLPGRLIGWNTNSEELHRVIEINQPAAAPDSFLNDIAVDLTNQAIFIADSSGAIITVDLSTDETRRVLSGSRFTTPENIDMVIEGRTIELGDAPARIGINPITIDQENEWLYFGAMSGTLIYRVKTKDLLNDALDDAELESRVEPYGDKPISDGSTIDSDGNVYITSVTDASIGVTSPSGYQTLIQSDALAWPDGFSVGADGMIYATINELYRSPILNGGENSAQGAFKIIRFKPLASAKTGR